MTLIKSNGLASIFASDDGRVLSLTFDTDKGTNMELEVPSVEMRPMIQQIMGVLLDAEAKSSLANQRIVSAISPAETRALRTEDGQDVLISFRLHNHLEYKFALSSMDALRLGQRIVEEAQKNSGASKPSSH